MGLVIKDIPGYPGLKADSEGHIIGRKGRRLKWQYSKGYPRVSTGKNTKMNVHSLICLAFHGPKPAGLQVRHLDNDKTNSRPENLKYGTSRENSDDVIKYGSQRGSKNSHSKLKESDVIQMRKLYSAREMTQKELANKYGVSQPCIFFALQGITAWKHVPDPCEMNKYRPTR